MKKFLKRMLQKLKYQISKNKWTQQQTMMNKRSAAQMLKKIKKTHDRRMPTRYDDYEIYGVTDFTPET